MSNKQPRLIVVDTSALAKTTIGYGQDKYSISLNGENYPTGYLFSLFQIFKKVPNLDLDVDKIVFCCDRRTIRKDINQTHINYFVDQTVDFTIEDIPTLDYPEEVTDIDSEEIGNEDNTNTYKDNRKENSESYFRQMSDAERDLADAGFTVLAKDGYEADDIIKYITAKYVNEFEEILVYCNDSDLSNVLDENNVIKLRKISKWSHDAQASTFEQEFKIPFNTMLLYKATVGDTTDRVKGVRGFGPKAFPSLMKFVESKRIEPSIIRELKLEESILRDYFKNDILKLKQAMYGLFLVTPIVRGLDFDINENYADKFKTVEMLSKYKMKSIISSIV